MSFDQCELAPFLHCPSPGNLSHILCFKEDYQKKIQTFNAKLMLENRLTIWLVFSQLEVRDICLAYFLAVNS